MPKAKTEFILMAGKADTNTIAELKQQEDQYRLVIDSIKDYAIIFLDINGNVALWNAGAERIKGYSAKEIIGQHFSKFYLPELIKQGFPEYELSEARKTGRFEDVGWRLRKDGSRFWANVIITPAYNKEKKLIGYAKITKDLTESRFAEEELKKSEERYRLLVDGIKDYAIYKLSPDGIIESWNEGAKRLKGYTEKEIIGKHFSIFYPEDKKAEGFPEYELKEAKLHGRFENEGWRIRKDKSRFFANVVITPLYNANNELIGFSKITRDLTERKRSEEVLNKLNSDLEKRVQERTEELSNTVAELKKINIDLDNFIYTASHDLKAPVTNIEGLIYALVTTLNDKHISDEEIDTVISMIKRSVSKFQETIRDLTEINQSQRNEREDIVSIKLKNIIDDVIQSIDHLVKEANAEILINTEALPDIIFSKTHVRSIIYNILINAVKYRSSERRLKIGIKTSATDEYYVIEISDNGLGIKPENSVKIFQMFKRMHAHVEGSGIGLYIVKRIVDNAGGKIEVKSEEGKGATFIVYLPR
jgi:PAS domain S-box-containing protein